MPLAEMPLQCHDVPASSEQLRHNEHRIGQHIMILHVLIAPAKAAAPPAPVAKANIHNHGRLTEPAPVSYAFRLSEPVPLQCVKISHLCATGSSQSQLREIPSAPLALDLFCLPEARQVYPRHTFPNLPVCPAIIQPNTLAF